MMAIPFTSSADDSEDKPKISLTFGMGNIINEGFDGLNDSQTLRQITAVNGEDDVISLMIGYDVTPDLSLEYGMISSSEMSASFSNTSGTLHGKAFSTIGTVDLKANSRASSLYGVKWSPNNDGGFGYYAKAGIMSWDVAYTATKSGEDANDVITYDGVTKSGRFLEIDGSNAYMGLGVSYSFNKNSSLILEYMTSEIHDSNVSLSSLSWTQKF